MTENVYAPPKSDIVGAEASDEKAFYVVSARKFAILYISTMGVFATYWFFKNWRLYKQASGKNVWPLPRAMFSVFFVHSLFRQVKERLSVSVGNLQWDSGGHATTLVGMLIVSTVLGRAAAKSIGSPLTDILSMAMLIPLFLSFSRAQKVINVACGDPDGKGNGELTPLNYFWIVVGIGLWALGFLGIVGEIG